MVLHKIVKNMAEEGGDGGWERNKLKRVRGWLVLPEALDLFNKVKELFVNSSKENQSSIGLVTTVLEAWFDG